jgi:hypothetical protein
MNALGKMLYSLAGLLLISLLFFTAHSQTIPANDKDHFRKLVLDIKSEYFLGEPILINISAVDKKGRSFTNGTWQRSKLDFEMAGPFSNETGTQKRSFSRDVMRMVPSGRTSTFNGITSYMSVLNQPTLEWLSETVYSIDAERTSGKTMGTGAYKFTVRSEHGYKIVKKFKITFDPVRSTPVMEKLLSSESQADRNWAYYHLSKFDRPALIAISKKMSESEDPKTRLRGRQFLDQLKVDGQL